MGKQKIISLPSGVVTKIVDLNKLSENFFHSAIKYTIFRKSLHQYGTINIGKRTSDFIETNVYGGECMVTFSCVSNGVIMVTKLGNEKDEVIVNFSISFEEFEQKHKEVGFNSPIYKK